MRTGKFHGNFGSLGMTYDRFLQTGHRQSLIPQAIVQEDYWVLFQ